MPNNRTSQKARRAAARKQTERIVLAHVSHASPASPSVPTVHAAPVNQLHDPAELMKILCEHRNNLAIAQGRLQIVSRSDFRVLHDVLARFALVDETGAPVPAIESARRYKRSALTLTFEQGMHLGHALAAHAAAPHLREEELWMFICRNYNEIDYRVCLNIAAHIHNAIGELNIANIAAAINGQWLHQSVAQVIGNNAVPHAPVFIMPRDFILGQEYGGVRGCFVLRIFGGLVVGSQHKIKAGISVHVGNLLHELGEIPFMHMSGYMEITHLQTVQTATATYFATGIAAQCIPHAAPTSPGDASQ